MLNKLKEMRKNLKKKGKGFTLVELIVVIVIIAIIAAVAIPRIVTFQESARKTRIQSEHRQLVTAIQSYLAQGDDPGARAAKLTSVEDLSDYMNLQPAKQGQQKATVTDQLATNTTTTNGTSTATVAHVINNGVLTSTFTSSNTAAVPSQTWTYNFK